MKSKLIKNITTGFGGQFIAIILGLIVPRLFITSYGSDVNGFLGTITQIFTYVALLEAGIGQAARNLLYKPFHENDTKGISEIASIAESYFRRFTLVYGAGVVAIALILPFVLKTNVDYLTIELVVLLEGMSGVISFYYVETPSIIICVDGKTYVNNTISIVNKILGYVIKIIMASFGWSIVLMQFAYFLVTVAKVFFYRMYFKKNYSWIQVKKTEKNIRLQDRNSYILTEICWTIFSSTDMIVLSTFVGTQLSSVYSIYNMIFLSISVLVNSIYSSVNYLLGYSYHESIEDYSYMHDAFNSIFLGMMTVLMAVCYCLTIPFITLYTQDVADINYIYGSLPLMFCLIQLISWSRYIGGNLTGIAGYAKQTSYISLIEALLNLLLSIVFVRRYGIVGVTLGTVIALPLKVIWCTYISDKKVMKRSYRKSISITGINFFFFFGVVFLSKFYQPVIDSYVELLAWGVGFTCIFGAVGMGLNFVVNKDCLRMIKKYILKKAED